MNPVEHLRTLIARRIHSKSFFIVLLAFLASLVVVAALIFAAGANPLHAYEDMLRASLGRYYGRGEVIGKAIPLILIAVGISVGLRAGLTNLGGDGQFFIGALVSVSVGLRLSSQHPVLAVTLALVAAMFFGGLWAALAGVLRAHLDTNEVITTIMLNYVALLLLQYMVAGPMKPPGSFLPQSATLPQAVRLPSLLMGTSAHYGIFIALASLVFLYLLFSRSVVGYRIRAVGQGVDAARYSGIGTRRYIVFAMFMSGAFAGVAGAVEVFGIHHRVLDGISLNYGFTGVVVALLGGVRPLGILGAALLLSVLRVGANAMQVTQGIPVSVVFILESLIILFALVGDGLRHRR